MQKPSSNCYLEKVLLQAWFVILNLKKSSVLSVFTVACVLLEDFEVANSIVT